jgi:hypothetical protein
MSGALPNFEGLLRQALAPVDPPEDLTSRLEGALMNITEIAAEELESWELSAMRDPRNWARPIAAIVVGGSAGVGLALLRARNRRSPARAAVAARKMADQAVGDFREEIRKLTRRG